MSMKETLKLIRGEDHEKKIRDILQICDRFWTQHKWIEVAVSPLSGKATKPQNDMQHVWYAEAERQGDMKAWEYRAECKLHCGVRILRRDSAEYREVYNKYILDLPYETKLAYMAEPFDFAVSRAMNKEQKSEFLDAVYERLTTEHGIRLERQAA